MRVKTISTEKIRPIPRVSVRLFMKNMLIKIRVNWRVPEVMPFSRSQAWNFAISGVRRSAAARVGGNEERDKIEHVEIETGSNEEHKIITPGKKERPVREDTAGKDERLSGGVRSA